MTSKIELFIMIVERNKVVRAAFNCRMKLAYNYKMYDKHREDLDKHKLYLSRMDEYEKESDQLTDAVYAFTKRTHKRRMELQKELKTRQCKRADNRVMWVRLGDGDAISWKEMERVVEDYELNNEIDSILLESE